MAEEKKEYKPGISFSWRSAGVRIYNDTVRALGNPEYIRFLCNEKEKHLAVQVCSMNETGSIKVPDRRDRQFIVSSLHMLRLLWKVCGWGKKDTLRAYGILYAANQVVDFNLNNVELITEAEFSEPESI